MKSIELASNAYYLLTCRKGETKEEPEHCEGEIVSRNSCSVAKREKEESARPENKRVGQVNQSQSRLVSTRKK